MNYRTGNSKYEKEFPVLLQLVGNGLLDIPKGGIHNFQWIVAMILNVYFESIHESVLNVDFNKSLKVIWIGISNIFLSISNVLVITFPY